MVKAVIEKRWRYSPACKAGARLNPHSWLLECWNRESPKRNSWSYTMLPEGIAEANRELAKEDELERNFVIIE